MPVERRVLRRLVELSDLYTELDGTAEVTVTQEAIAELPGAKRPTVNRVLRDEAGRGVIELMRPLKRPLIRRRDRTHDGSVVAREAVG